MGPRFGILLPLVWLDLQPENVIPAVKTRIKMILAVFFKIIMFDLYKIYYQIYKNLILNFYFLTIIAIFY